MELMKFYIANIDFYLLELIQGKSKELVDLIKSEKYESEEALAAQLCKGESASQDYQDLKDKTMGALEDFFLMSTPKSKDKAVNKAQECRRLYMLSMSMAQEEVEGAEECAKKMLLKAREIAVAYDFTVLALNCTDELMMDAGMKQKIGKFKYYQKQKKILFENMGAEHLAEEFYCRVVLHKGLGEKIEDKSYARMIAKMDALSCTTTKFVERYYMVRMYRSMDTGDYLAVKQDAETALEFLYNKKGTYSTAFYFFLKNKGFALLELGEEEEGHQLLIDAEQYPHE